MYNRQVEHAVFDETAVVASAVSGDIASFGALVEQHQEVAFRTAYLITRDAAMAEDAAQEAFVRAYRQIGSFRRDAPFRPWLLRIVTNVALNEVRSRRRRGGLFDRVASLRQPDVAAPDETVTAKDEADDVLKAINELPQDDRVILYLRYYVELPEREIADAIGRPPGTVKSRLHRASRRLRDVIEKKYPHLRGESDG